MGNLNLINHLYLSENGRKIGTQLIKDFSINRSNNLSLFLNVNKCLTIEKQHWYGRSIILINI